MALTPGFTTTQLYTNPKVLTITDTSTGTDGTITQRYVYLRKSDGTYLVPSGTDQYVVWPLADTSYDIGVLDKDYALDITVVWLAGTTPVYTLTKLVGFTVYSELFLRQLTQQQAGNPTLINNNNFWGNKIKLRTLIDDVAQAVSVLNDQSVSQFAINEAKRLTDNPQMFY